MTTAVMEIYETRIVQVPGLGKRIKAVREADPRSVREIARLADMGTPNWYRIEQEKQRLPLETLRRIEAVLGVDFGVKL